MLVKVNDHWGVLNRQRKWVAKPQFDYVQSFSSIDSLPVEINDKWGVIDREGKWLVQPRYHSIRGFNNLDTGFNRNGLSIANLASNREWRLISVEGDLFKFDAEVIEPYFSDEGDCFGFTATDSAFLPAINRKRD